MVLTYNSFMQKFKRFAGILLHISSLPSEFGIGDMGPKAYEFVDFLESAGQKIWQVLPLNPTKLEFGNSPYFSTSLFAGNILFVSPEILFMEGLLTRDELESIKFPTGDKVDYIHAYKTKEWVVQKAYEKFKNWDEFYEFVDEQRYWLDDYTIFEINRNIHKKTWNQWEELYKHEHQVRKVAFGQYIFFKQWYKLKEYANKKGILIMGDLPIYPAYDSSDVFANREIFKLDKDGNPTFVAGVPPDYFSPTGQLWGNPLYNWEELQKRNFDWWIQRISHNLKLYDLLRLDHFRGFVEYYQIPYGEKTAIKGSWVEAPAYEFFGKLKESFPNMPFIAEDLGTITPEVEKVRDDFGIPGIKLLYFAFFDDNSPYMPHNHVQNSLVATSTHDTMPIRSWFKEELDEKSRKRLLNYLGVEGLREEQVAPVLVRLAYMSVSKYCIIPMQDILNFDKESRMNTPGKRDGNWLWKMNEIPSQELENKLYNLCYTYGRR